MNFNSFRDQVLRNAERADRRWVYRGHAERSWKLETSYSRFHAKAFGDLADFNLECFERILSHFIRRASESIGEDYERYSPFQKMALAQHYGIPTPMLDWSHSPYVATYFAVTDLSSLHKTDAKFYVYAMDVADLPELSQEEEKSFRVGGGERFRFIDTRSFFSRRIARQSGCFTYQNFGGGLQEWQRSQPVKSVEINTYEVSGGRSQIIRELELMGVTGGNLFDDLDYVAKDIVHAELMRRQKPSD